VDSLPPSLTHLVFGFTFNQPLTSLPPSLTHLTVGPNFTYSLDSLPSTVRTHKLAATNEFTNPFHHVPLNATS